MATLSQPHFFDTTLHLFGKTLRNRLLAVSKDGSKYQTFFFHDILSAVKTRCYTDVEYKQNLADFFEFNDIFDAHRNESLMKINPELANLRDK